MPYIISVKDCLKVNKVYYILFSVMVLLVACEIKLKPNEELGDVTSRVEVQRYDRLQSRYLTTGDFSALQQMNIEFPMETRTLVEDVLRLGEVNDPEINSKFLNFYQDTILQSIIADAESQYANMKDINRQFDKAFTKLSKWLPKVSTPVIYAQIGALDQSIVIGDSSIGVSLDKYLGADYPLYRKYYTPQQRASMQRDHIVPDALCFYILSKYPLQYHDSCNQTERDTHMGKVMWVVNKVMGKKVFDTRYVTLTEAYMKKNSKLTAEQLLSQP